MCVICRGVYSFINWLEILCKIHDFDFLLLYCRLNETCNTLSLDYLFSIFVWMCTVYVHLRDAAHRLWPTCQFLRRSLNALHRYFICATHTHTHTQKFAASNGIIAIVQQAHWQPRHRRRWCQATTEKTKKTKNKLRCALCTWNMHAYDSIPAYTNDISDPWPAIHRFCNRTVEPAYIYFPHWRHVLRRKKKYIFCYCFPYGDCRTRVSLWSEPNKRASCPCVRSACRCLHRMQCAMCTNQHIRKHREFSERPKEYEYGRSDGQTSVSVCARSPSYMQEDHNHNP